ncbi:MAG TPA: glycosyltransferase family 4 protein [Ferruginibacter sp.]|nr:glycosyltransferase family 4 protein [Ferruginibacter sp.]
MTNFKTSPIKILFIVPYPLSTAPSQRFRIEQYFSLLKRERIQYKLAPFVNSGTYTLLYKKGISAKKIFGILMGFLRRLKLVFFESKNYEVIFIHREASPLGPPVFEWILAKLLKRKFIYDYDDAIWEPSISAANRAAFFAKAFWKIKYICKWAFINSAGNNFLENYAKQSGARQSLFLPTVVDAVNRYVPAKAKNNNIPPVIGWTGSHSTIMYLQSCIEILKELKQLHEFALVVISDKKPELDIDFVFVPWNTQTEIESLQHFDIGIMPLVKDRWSEGKCGFKIIQYMATGIPAVASPTGANTSIIDNGINGFICNSKEEWIRSLSMLLNDKAKREEMGFLARNKIEAHYSLQSQERVFLQLIKDAGW